jgi:hypothetical protein
LHVYNYSYDLTIIVIYGKLFKYFIQIKEKNPKNKKYCLWKILFLNIKN